jgi:cell division protease FtsH
MSQTPTPGGPQKPDSGPEKKGVYGTPQSPKWLIYIAVVIVLAMVVVFNRDLGETTKEFKSYPAVLEQVREGNVKELVIRGSTWEGTLHEGYLDANNFEAKGVPFNELPEDTQRELEQLDQEIDHFNFRTEEPSAVGLVLLNFLPWVLFFVIIYYLFFRQMRGSSGPGGVLSFGKSRANLVSKEKTRKTFKDVAGVAEAKEEVEEIIGFLREPDKYQRLGGRIPRGVLLIGAPGTGKTLLAKAIAGEADVPFYSISGSDFVEMFVGVGASRVRDLFQQARDNAPCIIFLDEIDAVGRRRGTGLGGGHDEREQTLNAILVEMDGFASDEKIIVMAATNRPDVLDPALLRPGRFDRHIYVDSPDVKGREEILRVHANRVRMASSVDMSIVARYTPGFSGADLENLVNESALIAVKHGKDAVEMEDLEEARDKVLWGREKRSRVVPKSDLKVTAIHESGHAIVGYLETETDRPHKITIIPRGPSLGATAFLPERDTYNMSRSRLLGEIRVLLGGRTAELLLCDNITTGAKNDIERATKIARRMVCEWGMSDELGPVNYATEEEHMFLGREVARTRDHSEQTSIMIDKEVRRIIEECQAEARRVIEEHRDEIEAIADALLENEVLTAEDLERLMNGKPIEPRRRTGTQSDREKQQETEAERAHEDPQQDRGSDYPGAEPAPADD